MSRTKVYDHITIHIASIKSKRQINNSRTQNYNQNNPLSKYNTISQNIILRGMFAFIFNVLKYRDRQNRLSVKSYCRVESLQPFQAGFRGNY